MGKKRSRSSLFETVEALDTEDARALTKGRKAQERDVKRSQAAQSQSKIYGNLVECRILLQRSILAATPSKQNASEGKKDINEKETESAVIQCNNLLTKLLMARQKLHYEDDEEEKDYETIVKDADTLEETLSNEYDIAKEEWKKVLDRRHKDVRLHSGALTNKTQFKVMDSSFWQQVEATVQHEEHRQQQQQQQTSSSSTQTLFDDTKVYQHLLKDFVTHSQTDNDVQTAAQQRLLKQQQKKNNSNKSNNNVDRKASKGRKIRYNEISKLVNFTFPLSRYNNTNNNNNLDEDAWFRSLFGGAGITRK